MTSILKAVPKFAAEVRLVLSTAGRQDLAKQVATAVIERCTVGDEDDVAYIHFNCPGASLYASNLSKQVASSLSFSRDGFVVDIGHDGHMYGIELLNREEVVASLRAANAL